MISLSTLLIRQAGLKWTPSGNSSHLVFVGVYRVSDESFKCRAAAHFPEDWVLAGVGNEGEIKMINRR